MAGFMRDYFGRKEENAYTYDYDNRRLSHWDRGVENYSDFLMGDRKKSKNSVAKLLGNMFRVMGLPKDQAYSASGNKGIKIPVDYLEKALTSSKSTDIFYGAALHEAAHHIFTDPLDKSKSFSERAAAKKGDLLALINTLLNEERIQKKNAEVFGGYNKFIQKYKDDLFSKVKATELTEDFNFNREEVMQLLTTMIRYPSLVSEEMAKKYDKLVEKLSKIFEKEGGIPDEYSGIEPISKKIHKAVLEYIIEEEEPPRSEGGSDDDSDGSDSPEDKGSSSHSSSRKLSGSKGDDSGILSDDSSESSDGDSCSGDSEGDGGSSGDKGDSSESTDDDSEGSDSGSSKSSESKDKEKELSDSDKKERSKREREEKKRKLKELSEELTDTVKDTFKDFVDSKEEITDKDAKTVESFIKDFSEEEDLAVTKIPYFFNKEFPTESGTDVYKRTIAKLDLTKTAVLRKLFERKIVSYDFTLKSMRSGRLDTNKIAEARQNVPNVYEHMGHVETNHICIGILVDESGSMSGNRIQKAREAAIFIQETFAKLRGVELFIYGHSGDRIKDLSTDLYIYREPGFDKNPETLGNISARCQNRDGDAIWYTAKRIREFTKNPGILIIISDGEPCAGAYYHGIEQTHKMVNLVEKKLNLIPIQIAIDESVRSELMFKYFVKMTDIAELPYTLLTYLSSKVDKMFKKQMTL